MSRKPRLREFNAYLLAEIAGFSKNKGYQFEPASRDPRSPINPRDPGYDGVEADVMYRGERVARARGDGATYCCGVTFEIFMRAWVAWSGAEVVGDLDASDVRALIADWFCPTMGHSGVVSALVDRGLGVQIAQEHAQPGDLCQFWRSVDLGKPSGHSVLFLAFGARDGERTLEYWSSQPATGGIGAHTEVIGPGWEIHLVRVGAE